MVVVINAEMAILLATVAELLRPRAFLGRCGRIERVCSFLFPAVSRKIILIATFVEDTDREEGSKNAGRTSSSLVES
jgi:hypothetical protein